MGGTVDLCVCVYIIVCVCVCTCLVSLVYIRMPMCIVLSRMYVHVLVVFDYLRELANVRQQYRNGSRVGCLGRAMVVAGCMPNLPRPAY